MKFSTGKRVKKKTKVEKKKSEIKTMRSATECAPKKCRCGASLPKPKYEGIRNSGYAVREEHLPLPGGGSSDRWLIPCTCGIVYVWAFHPVSNGCWKIRSNMPLWDSGEIVVVA